MKPAAAAVAASKAAGAGLDAAPWVAEEEVSRQRDILARMAERRDALKQDYARDWEKMERRHAAERIRDERMIERKSYYRICVTTFQVSFLT